MEEQILKQLAQPLLAWYDIHRRILPWREEVSPYRTWVSEIMLQQTRVAAVLDYYRRFMEALPTVADLAAVEEDRLMKLWQGLGYYNRARNLQKAARQVAEDFGGVFPDTYEGLLTLSGVGEYTAGAIASIAFGVPVPAVDGNVLRLAARITGSCLDVLDAKNRKAFRNWMAAAMSQERPGAYNQALMDLGATVCLPSGAPLCGDCPAGDFCIARQEGCQARLPVRSPKREKRTEHLTVFLLRRGAAAALRQRPDTGLLAGLWEYPHVPGTLTEAEAARQLQMWGVNPTKWTKKLSARHIFTHVRWEMTGYVVEVNGLGPGDWLWAEAQQRERLAIPSAFEKFTAELKEGE